MGETEKLFAFLEALDEWGCEDNAERASAILDFIASGYDLNAYKDRPQLSVIQGGLEPAP